MTRSAVLVASLFALVACGPICGIGAHLTLSNARVDSSYTCPNGSDNKPYIVHGFIDVDNYTTKKLTIKAVKEHDELVKTGGNWDGPTTAVDDGPVDGYSPKTINAGDKTTLKLSIGFKCTNSGAGSSTFGEFSFKFTVQTDNGTFTLTANHHRLGFA